jgi:type II secretory pathway component PulC
LPVPAEAGLTLQAISWSARAEQRIAVIDGRVLHQGDSIAGYLVETIEPDTVTLSQTGRVYRLAFRPGA